MQVKDNLTVSDAAVFLGISVDYLRRLADAGKVPCARTPEGWRSFRRSDLERVRRQREARAAKSAAA